MKEFENQYLVGDCEKVLKRIPDNTFDLIITSLMYADSRKNTYPGKWENRFRDS